MKRKKGLALSALIETLILAILLVLFYTGSISLNLFLALAVVVGLISTFVVMVIIRKTEP